MDTPEQRVQAEEDFGLQLMQYAGQWVAVLDHNIVATDEHLGPLVDRLNGQRDSAEIFQVPKDHGSACL